MKNELTKIIIERLNEEKERLKKEFAQRPPLDVARYFTVDNLLPASMAENIYKAFPNPKQMHLLYSPGKIKLKYSHLKDTPLILQAINAAIQNPSIVALIEEITGIKNQIPDPTRFAGGVSTLLKGYYINPHIDNSHDVEKKRYYRTLNVLYYVSPNWKLDNGGNYELWDRSIKQRIIVPSLFNRLVVMETNRFSWHAVNRVVCNEPRCCIFNYFFSKESPEEQEYFFDKPSFRARPEQKIRRIIEALTLRK